ncbi:hypothetical protein B0T18DRAFT_427701 [Schizothecium vesticola]|uniref:NAD(P)-binding protein n=1 Tax=Schizothecium vesticola TaxID=314040 RepID=A0AA40F1P1_9PEZI|nr:hypothetical protein B0T18DRAFT_427701 [Schizothecium vesticola]
MSSKAFIVTGASRGIGLAVAKHLLKTPGNKVVAISRSLDELLLLKDQFPTQVEVLAEDMTQPEASQKATQLAISKFGRLDGVVINHGALSPMTRLADASVEEWKRLYDVNLFSALALVKETIPHLRATKGSMVFVSSGAAINAYTSWGAGTYYTWLELRGLPGSRGGTKPVPQQDIEPSANYGSSKAALNSLARHVAVEEPNILAVAISPGRVDTGMQKELRDKGGAAMAEKDYAGFVSAFEGGTLNKPEWPAAVIANLAVGMDPKLSGQYFSWNAVELASYQEKN